VWVGVVWACILIFVWLRGKIHVGEWWFSKLQGTVFFFLCADRESACRWTDTLTDAIRFYNPSHAICYSYGADTYRLKLGKY